VEEAPLAEPAPLPAADPDPLAPAGPAACALPLAANAVNAAAARKVQRIFIAILLNTPFNFLVG
jgi:hypothetical protein